jgi:hypothetical protein
MYRTLMIAAIAIVMFSLSTFAQPRMSPQERVKALTEKLSLTKDQAAQIEQIYIQTQNKMKKMNEDGKSDRTVMRKMMEDTQEQVNNVLDDKQKVEFKKLQDERKNNMQKRKPINKPQTKSDEQKSE